jgi:4-diphosphocytidyl-2-C-methyl-D-erythritol kinase
MTLRAFYDLPAPAKLNAFLHVIGRRGDGYHLLQSPFVLIDWADTLHFERRDDGRLQRHDLGAALPDDDLCLRAARALQTASGTAMGADISIHKHVPWGAGMGGGSSDAATTLLALNRLWSLDWPRTRLIELAVRLGADVPFFIGGSNAFVEGIGEQLTPLVWPQTSYAVVKPPATIATQDIFTHPALVRDTDPVILFGSFGEATDAEQSGHQDGGSQDKEGSRSARRAPRDWVAGFGRNDLQAPAVLQCAEVAQALDWLGNRFGNSRMTGSGSAVFSKVGSEGLPMATPATDLFQGLPPGWVGRMCRSLPRHPLGDWAR